MDEVRERNTPGRGPVLYDPAREQLGWLVILAITSGVIAGAWQDARGAGDHEWAIILAAMFVLDLIAYFNTALFWVKLRTI